MFHRRLVFPVFMLGSILSIAILSCSSTADLPNPFASATPTPTATFTPTATPSPTPTPTLTPTPLPTGVTVHSQSSGTTLVQDWDNHFELTLPRSWVAIPLTKQDLDRLLEQVASQDPEFGKVAQQFKQMDPNIIRLFGLNSDRKYSKGEYPTLVSVTALADPVLSSMPMAFVTAVIEDKVLVGAKDTTWEVKKNANGVEVGIVQGSLKIHAPLGTTVNTKAKVIAFQVNKKLIMMEFVTPTQFGAEVLPAVDQIIDTIQLTGSSDPSANLLPYASLRLGWLGRAGLHHHGAQAAIVKPA